jgi:glycosyltransferase involved in cell wall biosynthesis
MAEVGKTSSGEREVLILSPFFSPNTGGVETHLDDLVALISKSGLPATVATCQPLTSPVRGDARELRGTVEIRRKEWPSGNWFHRFESMPVLQMSYLFPPVFGGGLRKMLESRTKVGCVHAHGLAAAAAARTLAGMFGVPFYISIHAYYESIQGAAVRSCIRRICKPARKVFCLSDHVKAQFRDVCGGDTQLETFRYWLPSRFFDGGSRDQTRKKLGAGGGAKVFLFVGRLIEKKGVRILVEAFEKLRDGSVLWIAGDGPEEGWLREKAATNPSIRLLGRVPNEELPDYYAAADLLIVPSQYPEGFGRSAMESAACGTPVLACDEGGITEFIRPPLGECIKMTAANLAGKLASFKIDAGVRDQCKKWAWQNFAESNGDIFIQAYGEALA